MNVSGRIVCHMEDQAYHAAQSACMHLEVCLGEKCVIVCMHGGYLANQTCRVKLSHQNVTLTDNVNFDVCSLNA